MKVPRAVRAEVRLGLRLWSQGLAGPGLRAETVEEACLMAEGLVTPDKVTRMRAWFARHGASGVESDARARQAAELAAGTLRGSAPALVAWLLWGGDAGREWVASLS